MKGLVYHRWEHRGCCKATIKGDSHTTHVQHHRRMFMFMVFVHLQPPVTQTYNSFCRYQLQEVPWRYHGAGVWLFICLAHQNLPLTQFCRESTFENTFIFPSCLTGRALVQVRTVGHCVTEIICVEFPWNEIVNLKPLYQKKRQDNGSWNMCA